jgi:hypothetical protein
VYCEKTEPDRGLFDVRNKAKAGFGDAFPPSHRAESGVMSSRVNRNLEHDRGCDPAPRAVRSGVPG